MKGRCGRKRSLGYKDISRKVRGIRRRSNTFASCVEVCIAQAGGPYAAAPPFGAAAGILLPAADLTYSPKA